MNMKCDNIEALLFAYFSGTLTRLEEQELMEWIKADEQHKKVISEMADWWAIAHVPLFESDIKSDFEAHFGTIANREVSQEKKKYSLLTPWLRIAASVLVLLAVGIASYHIGKESLLASHQEMMPYEVEVPLGSQSRVVLPDQSVVWLNAGSSVKYAENKEKRVRELQLKGEAYFDIAPDTTKPFIVKTEKMDIRVVGTSFNVKAYDDDEMADVALVSGKVDVMIGSRSENIRLEPNQKLALNKETNDALVTTVYGPDYYAWKEGNLRFSEQPFSTIAKDMERAYNVKIKIESELLKSEVFSGSFTKHHLIDDILKEIDVDNKYTWTQNGNQYTICER